ncbi:MAG TPA: hypothetical protein VGB31_04010 [Myxococcota bacterium]
MVLIADPEIEQGKSTASALARWGLQPALVHDGVEAILAIQRLLPRAIVIDAALPKMFGFQICEIVKRNESLRNIKVVLVGAIHDRARYRRPPEEIYGADAYIERQELPDSLRSILQGFGMLVSVAQEPPVSAAAATPLAPPVPAPASAVTPAPTAADPGIREKIEQAERLARIVVSDIVLYSKEKFEAAVQAGNVLEAMQPEIAEGRSLFTARVEPAIQEMRDFLADELLRVATLRGKS